MSTVPNLSLIICSKNRSGQLSRCLKSINEKEMLNVNGELILVNNGSTDNTEKVMRSFKEKSRFPVKIVNESKQGLGSARNAGLLKAKGEVLVFTDDDCYLTKGYLTKASKVFESGEFDYCGGRIFLYDPTDALCTVHFVEDPYPIPPHSVVIPGMIHGANMIFSRKVVDKIGLFDPMFGCGTPFLCEDVDYVARASMAGFKGKHVPELIVYHHHGRKPIEGKDDKEVRSEYNYAFGAYYTKFILMGNYGYLKHWILSTRHTKIRNLIREIKGSLWYLSARINGFLNKSKN